LCCYCCFYFIIADFVVIGDFVIIVVFVAIACFVVIAGADDADGNAD